MKLNSNQRTLLRILFGALVYGVALLYGSENGLMSFLVFLLPFFVL